MNLKIQEMYKFFFNLKGISQILWFEQIKIDAHFATTVLICQLINLFALRGGKKRLKEESSILSIFHFSSFWGQFIFCEIFIFMYDPSHIFFHLHWKN